LESEIIRKCLSRSEFQCSFLEYRGYKVIYRRYASLFFIVGTRPDIGQSENNENELGMLEFIHTLVETMDKWAGSICELDIMYQLEQVHFLLGTSQSDKCFYFLRIVEHWSGASGILSAGHKPVPVIQRFQPLVSEHCNSRYTCILLLCR
jgi:hypothetical protein